jgi:hypothetical protein
VGHGHVGCHDGADQINKLTCRLTTPPASFRDGGLGLSGVRGYARRKEKGKASQLVVAL